MIKSLSEQIEAMNSKWPSFKVVELDQRQRLIVWEGTLKPQSIEYEIRISYIVPLVVENWTVLNIQPRISVLNPVLELHPSYEEGPLPHVYNLGNYLNGKKIYLCTFDPYKPEWSPKDLIANTIIYWIAKWLYFYEGWLLTTKWKGGGRHLTHSIKKKLAND